MRISNGIRKLEDSTIKAVDAIKPKASWMLRKTVMTTTIVVMLPIGIVAGAVAGAASGVVECGGHMAVTGIKAIREV